MEHASTASDLHEPTGPLADASLDPELAHQWGVVRSEFDREYYLLRNPDVAQAGIDPLVHFVLQGWREDCDPNDSFSIRAYLNANPDIVEGSINPFYHYIAFGRSQGRPLKPPVGSLEPADARLAAEWRVVRDHFDADYYLSHSPDVERSGIDPLVHFLQAGWREGRDPNFSFSIRDYLEENEDVAEAGINPFFHYLVAGKSEGRPLRPNLGFRYGVLSTLQSLEDRAAEAPPIPASAIHSDDELRSALRSLTRSAKRRVHVTVSHDNYTVTVGGLQVCLVREAAAFERMGFDHIHFFPARPLLVTDSEDPDPATGVLINGAFAGTFRASTIERVLRPAFASESTWTTRSLALHSLLGHNVPALVEILKALRIHSGHFWVHDFASVCAGLTLLRNDVASCGAPSIESAACGICIYGERRRLQVADHAYLFEELELTVVAPSAVALDTWRRSVQFATVAEIVHPHCRFHEDVATAREPRKSSERRALKVAFLGHPAVHKGWPVFRELLLRFGSDRRYEFHHLGDPRQGGLPALFTPVRVGKSAPDAMTEAIRKLDIDFAFIWSLWPETFCFTAHEAIAGGAHVIAPEYSGNVARMVEEVGRGVVVPDEERLYALFETGDIARFAKGRTSEARLALRYSEMTADLVSVPA